MAQQDKAPAPETETVRTTMRPWEDLEVPADEAAQLRREGLLAEPAPVTGSAPAGKKNPEASA